MRRVISIALHDLRLTLADRGAVMWMFFLPLVFATFFGLVIGGGASPIDAQATLTIVDRDQEDVEFFGMGFLSAAINLKGYGSKKDDGQVWLGCFLQAVTVVVCQSFGICDRPPWPQVSTAIKPGLRYPCSITHGVIPDSYSRRILIALL